MMRFLGFGRKDSSKPELPEPQPEILETDTSEESDDAENVYIEEIEPQTDTDIFHEAEDFANTPSDTDYAEEVVQETVVEEAILKEEGKQDEVVVAKSQRNKSIENVKSEYLVSIMEKKGQEALHENLSEEAENASHVLSQLSVDLFENTVRDDPDFPRDLDRIYSWFIDVLTDAERMTCAHVLLSTLTPNQLKFLFSSLSVDPDARAEVAYLDLAKSEASLKRDTVDTVLSSPSLLDFSRFSSLEFKPEDGLFGNMSLSSSTGSLSNGRFESLGERSRSPTSKSEESSPDPKHKTAPAPTEPEPTTPPGFDKVDHLSGLFNRFEKSASASSREAPKLSSLKLSIDAPEFRPIPNYPEMAYANIYYSDFLNWLRTLRLHKYGEVLLPHYERSKADLLRSSEDDLEGFGVCALGARRKFKRLFEQILIERPPE
jgi:hypothetical protein